MLTTQLIKVNQSIIYDNEFLLVIKIFALAFVCAIIMIYLINRFNNRP
jgi:hypothetical protein